MKIDFAEYAIESFDEAHKIFDATLLWGEMMRSSEKWKESSESTP